MRGFPKPIINSIISESLKIIRMKRVSEDKELKDSEQRQIQLKVLHQHMFGFMKDLPKPPELNYVPGHLRKFPK